MGYQFSFNRNDCLMLSCIKKNTYIIAACVYPLLFACTSRQELIKLDDGFIINLKQAAPGSASSIRLTAITPKIIRVTATGTTEFPTTESLMRDHSNLPAVAWTEQHNATEAILKTNSISATVSFATGEVVFKDSSGNIILQEKAGGGKTIIPVKIDEKPLYHVSQHLSRRQKKLLWFGATANRYNQL